MMVITFGQQYNVGEKPTVILYTYINPHGRTPDKTLITHQKQCSNSTPSHMVVVVIYYYIVGYTYKATLFIVVGVQQQQ